MKSNIKKSKRILSDMIFTQDFINTNFKYASFNVKKMRLNNQLTEEEYRVFALKHGMVNDKKNHSFSEISKIFDYSVEKTLKLYNDALSKVSENIRNILFNAENIR